MELVKIDLTNVWKIVKLKVNEAQEDFVAPNHYSIAEKPGTAGFPMSRRIKRQQHYTIVLDLKKTERWMGMRSWQ